MREIVFDVLTHDTPLLAVIPAGRFKELGSLQSPPDLAQGPWAGIKMVPLAPGVGPVQLQGVEVWVYDQPGSYEVIDQVNRLIRTALLAAAPRSFTGSDLRRIWLNSVEFQGESGDLFDDQWRAAVRNQFFRLAGSGI